jgi:hypothetical protein
LSIIGPVEVEDSTHGGFRHLRGERHDEEDSASDNNG